MQIKSLRLRLLLAAGLAIVVALIISGFLLARLFVHHVERRVAAELQVYHNQIVAGVEVAVDGTIQATASLSDPRFQQPYGGLYWQLDFPDGKRLRSRSLWDFALALPTDDLLNGAIHQHSVAGPQKAVLFAVERAITMDALPNDKSYRLIVAIDRREIDEAEAEFRAALWNSLLVIGTALLAAFGAMLQVGLLPLKRLSDSLQRVHSGDRPTVEGTFPTEVQLLVSDVNRLLEQQRQSVVRAREQASDLAHGFKTPLAVLSAVGRDLQRDGRASSAQEIESQVELMGRHVRRELARARMAGASGVAHGGVVVKPIAEKIVAAMQRIAGDRDLAWSVEGRADSRFAGDETDLLEILGNLSENAGRFARSKVRISVETIGASVDICVDDDGPGIPEGAEVDALMRGKRLDETTDGTGLGLAIVAKSIGAYDGLIELSRSPLGGLRVRLTLPAAAIKM